MDGATLGAAIALINKVSKDTKKKYVPIAKSSASGRIVSFADGADDVPFDSFVINIAPVQKGAGTPSPTNVRDIGGFSGCNIYQSGEDFSNPTTVTFSWSGTAGTIGIGILNVLTGVLKVTHGYKRFTGDSSEGWSAASTAGVFVCGWADVKNKGITMCNMSVSAYGAVETPSYGIISNTASGFNIRTHLVDTAMTLQEFRTWLSTHNLEIVAPLVTEVEYTLTPAQMKTLLGANTIWCDAGEIVCTYTSDVNSAIASMIEREPEFGKRTSAIFKKIGFAGDSYMSGVVVNGTTSSTAAGYSWVDHYAKITGSECVNMGVTGATAGGWLSDSGGLAKAQIAANKCQAYVIGLGIADIANNTPLGGPSDIGTDNQTFTGYFSKVIDSLFVVNGDAQIFVLMPPELPVGALATIRSAISGIVSWYQNNSSSTHKTQVHLVDLMNYAKEFYRNGCYNAMFSASGYEYIAELIIEAISKYINQHYSNFSNVNLIEYGTSA